MNLVRQYRRTDLDKLYLSRVEFASKPYSTHTCCSSPPTSNMFHSSSHNSNISGTNDNNYCNVMIIKDFTHFIYLSPFLDSQLSFSLIHARRYRGFILGKEYSPHLAPGLD